MTKQQQIYSIFFFEIIDNLYKQQSFKKFQTRNSKPVKKVQPELDQK